MENVNLDKGVIIYDWLLLLFFLQDSAVYSETLGEIDGHNYLGYRHRMKKKQAERGGRAAGVGAVQPTGSELGWQDVNNWNSV